MGDAHITRRDSMVQEVTRTQDAPPSLAPAAVSRPGDALQVRPPRLCSDCTVRRLALFRPFDGEALQALNRLRAAIRVLDPGTTIQRLDQPPDELFTVFSGWAFSYKDGADGRRQIIDFHLPGDLIGAEALAVAAPRIGTEALTRVSLCVFRRQPLVAECARIPGLGAALTWMAAREEAVLAERIESLGRRRAAVRLGHLLLELWTRQRWREQAPGPTCDLPPSHRHLADCLGLSAEHLSRALGELRRTSLVRLARRRLTVPDPDALARYADWSDGYLRPRPLL